MTKQFFIKLLTLLKVLFYFLVVMDATFMIVYLVRKNYYMAFNQFFDAFLSVFIIVAINWVINHVDYFIDTESEIKK
jgi:uncharacterized membrane protein YvlD (DUF360 family)